MFSSAIRRLNDRRDGAGDAGDDAGFTLIELMVVLLILAILLAIAIPTFLGVTKSANDRAAQSNLNTALINAKAAFQQAGQTYTTFNTATLSSAEPSLSYTTGTTNSQSTISVYSSLDGNGVAHVYLVQVQPVLGHRRQPECDSTQSPASPNTRSTPTARLPVPSRRVKACGTARRHRAPPPRQPVVLGPGWPT